MIYKKLPIPDLNIGDLVSKEVVTAVVTNGGNTKARLFVGNYAQSGNATDKYDSVLHKYRAAYKTFVKQESGLWFYAGICFFLETNERNSVYKEAKP